MIFPQLSCDSNSTKLLVFVANLMIRIKPPPQKRVPLTNSFTKEQLEPNCGSNDAVLII
jgi:hypothetical protein